MSQIIVHAHTSDDRIGVVPLGERAAPTDSNNEQYIAQRIERISWALIHAEWHESLSNVLDSEGPTRQDSGQQPRACSKIRSRTGPECGRGRFGQAEGSR
jgi:hypothetical protein